jgi:hypothetical protein
MENDLGSRRRPNKEHDDESFWVELTRLSRLEHTNDFWLPQPRTPREERGGEGRGYRLPPANTPSVERDLLMLAPSFSPSPVEPVAFDRSDPARSIKFSLERLLTLYRGTCHDRTIGRLNYKTNGKKKKSGDVVIEGDVRGGRGQVKSRAARWSQHIDGSIFSLESGNFKWCPKRHIR